METRRRVDSSRIAALAALARARRERLKLRQEEVADLAGCSERFVHSLENGKSTVRLDKVLDVLEVLGLALRVVPGHGEVIGGDVDREERSS